MGFEEEECERLAACSFDDKTGMYYCIEDCRVCIMGSRHRGRQVEIPAAIKGLPVTSIGESAFRDWRALKFVNIPEGVERIGYYAFRGCSLESLHLPSSIRDLGNACFERNVKLTSLEFCEGLKSITASAFRNCTNLEDLHLPRSIETIGDGAFSGCRSLEKIDFPEGLREIGSWAFSTCESLSAIDIPASVAKLGTGAFFGCKWLMDVRLHEGLRSVGDRCFCSCLSLKQLNLPEGLEYLGAWACSDCPDMRLLMLPDSVQCFEKWLGPTPAGRMFFARCVALEEMDPHSYRTAAAAGFIARKRAGFDYEQDLERSYFSLIKADIEAVCEQCGYDGDLIWWLVNGHIIGLEEVDVLTQAAARKGRIEATAILLECAKHLGGLKRNGASSLEL